MTAPQDQPPSVPTRIVIDSSVLLRYLIKPGAAVRELVETWWLSGKVQMVTAPDLLAELEAVLARPSIIQIIRPEEGRVLLETIRLLADMMPPLGPIPAFTRDPKDDKFIACALAGQARFVVSADEDLLALREVDGIRMITPYHLLVWLRQETPNNP
jgi:hypothetical protein